MVLSINIPVQSSFLLVTRAGGPGIAAALLSWLRTQLDTAV